MNFTTSLRCFAMAFLFSSVTVACRGQESNLPPAERCQEASCKLDGQVESPPLKQDRPVGAPSDDENDFSLKAVFTNIPGDQKAIWTSPFHLRARDSAWLFPMLGSTGLLIATDRHNMAHERSNTLAVQRSDNVANGGLIGLAGVPAIMYAWGTLNGHPRLRETGLLSGEALADSLVVGEVLNFAFGRERPTQTDGTGKFFNKLGNASFPSNHAVLSWTAASVLAHEYPGVLSQTAAYGAAAAVSIARTTGRKHFPSDVLVGSTLGWMIGRQVFRAHHNQDLDFGIFSSGESENPPTQSGTSYVPMDRWVYPLFDRLGAMGHLDSAIVGIRPWTRAECARLLEQVGQSVDPGTLEFSIYHELAEEFSPEMEGRLTEPDARIEEAYVRAGGGAGQVLADDYHFAKTFVDDFGRPFGNGANAIAGMSSRATVGPLSFYVRGEYQHAGTLQARSSAAQLAIAAVDNTPTAPQQRRDSLDRLRVLDAYGALTFHGNTLSFGKQTLWWGPGADAPFLFSNNAEPIPMLRLSRSAPLELPSIFHWLGAIRAELFFGQLNGHQFVAFFDGAGTRHVVEDPIQPHPFIQGAKVSFKMTRNFEFGLGVTALLGGPDFPLTLHSLLRSYSPGNTIPGQLNDPGDRRSAFDFSYRIPGVRDWMTLYSDSFTEDEFSPISFPRKSSFRAGLYLPKLPKLPQVELRGEGIYTDIPSLGGVGVAYSNGHYLSGYTNFGQIIGNVVGREGRGLNLWATYHFSALNNIQAHYRSQHVNPEFLQGGHLRDFDLTCTLARAGGFVVSGVAKYEHWNFPLLSAAPRSNFSASLQISFRPHKGLSLFGDK